MDELLTKKFMDSLGNLAQYFSDLAKFKPLYPWEMVQKKSIELHVLEKIDLFSTPPEDIIVQAIRSLETEKHAEHILKSVPEQPDRVFPSRCFQVG